jgi:hypothetical protein
MLLQMGNWHERHILLAPFRGHSYMRLTFLDIVRR